MYRSVFCPDCRSAENFKAVRDKNKHLKYTYGITLYEASVILAEQDHECTGCGRALRLHVARVEKGKPRQLDQAVVDHCHTTKKVRGLLCHHCNVAVGHMQDDPDIAARLTNYLRNHTT